MQTVEQQTNETDPGAYEKIVMRDTINADVMDEIFTSNERLTTAFYRNEKRKQAGVRVHPAYGAPDTVRSTRKVYNPLLVVRPHSRKCWYSATSDTLVGMVAIPTPDQRGLCIDTQNKNNVAQMFTYQH